MTFLCFFLIIGGLKNVFVKSSKSNLPVYSGTGGAHTYSVFSFVFFEDCDETNSGRQGVSKNLLIPLP